MKYETWNESGTGEFIQRWGWFGYQSKFVGSCFESKGMLTECTRTLLGSKFTYFRRTDNNNYILFVYLNSSSKCAFNESFVWFLRLGKQFAQSFVNILIRAICFVYEISFTVIQQFSMSKILEFLLFLRFWTGYLVIVKV